MNTAKSISKDTKTVSLKEALLKTWELNNHEFPNNINNLDINVKYLVSQASKEEKLDHDTMRLVCQMTLSTNDVPNELMDDEEFVFSLFSNDFTIPYSGTTHDKKHRLLVSARDTMSNRLAYNSEFAQRLVKENVVWFKYLLNSMKSDEKLILTCLKDEMYGWLWDEMEDSARDNERILFAFYKRNPLFTYKEIFNNQDRVDDLWKYAKQQKETDFIEALYAMNYDKWDGDKKNNWYPTAQFEAIVDLTVENITESKLKKCKRDIVSDYLLMKITDRLKMLKTLNMKQRKSKNEVVKKKSRKSGMV